MLKIAALCALMVLSAPTVAQTSPTSIARTTDERAVLAADARQRDAVANVDLKALAAISHRNLRVNAPNNRVLTREDLIRMVGSGEIRNEVFERVPETVVVTGNIGVVMGRETSSPRSEASRPACTAARRSTAGTPMSSSAKARPGATSPAKPTSSAALPNDKASPRTGGQILVDQLRIQGCDRVFTVRFANAVA